MTAGLFVRVDNIAQTVAALVLAFIVLIALATRPKALLGPLHSLAQDGRVDKSESCRDGRLVFLVDYGDGQRLVGREAADLAEVAVPDLFTGGRRLFWASAVAMPSRRGEVGDRTFSPPWLKKWRLVRASIVSGLLETPRVHHRWPSPCIELVVRPIRRSPPYRGFAHCIWRWTTDVRGGARRGVGGTRARIVTQSQKRQGSKSRTESSNRVQVIQTSRCSFKCL